MEKKLTEKDIHSKVLENFAAVADTIGYSPLHGKIIGVLLLEGSPVSLPKLAKETGYSISMVSLSLDFLELMEVIKKVKKTGDRKLYVELKGDLIEVLKKAIVTRVKKVIKSSLEDFDESRKHLDGLSEGERKRAERSITTLEKEIKRLDYYVNLLSGVDLP